MRLPFVVPFRTARATTATKDALLVRVTTSAGTGWGECTAPATPEYDGETIDGARLALRDHLLPRAFAGKSLDDVRGHRAADAALSCALLDARLRAEGISLAGWLGADGDVGAGRRGARLRRRPRPPAARRRPRTWPPGTGASSARSNRDATSTCSPRCAAEIGDERRARRRRERQLLPRAGAPAVRRDRSVGAAVRRAAVCARSDGRARVRSSSTSRHPICLDETITDLDAARDRGGAARV